MGGTPDRIFANISKSARASSIFKVFMLSWGDEPDNGKEGLLMIRLALVLMLSLGLSVRVLAQSAADLTLAHEGGVVTAAWSADESHILTAAEDGLVRLWSADGEPLLTIDHQGEPLAYARWHDGGAAILSADESGLVLHSSAIDGSQLQSWQLAGRPLALDLNADESRALVFTDSGQGAILSLADGEIDGRFEGPGLIRGAGWSADESQVRAWSEDSRVVVWELETGEIAADYSLPHRGVLMGLAWNRDDARLLAWYADGAVFVYETDGISIGRAVSRARHRSFVQRAIWSDDETRYMSWGGDDTVYVRFSDTGESEGIWRHEDWVVGASWDGDESRVLSWSHIYLYLWNSTELARRLRHDNLVRGAVWNKDGTRILSWSWDGSARVWTP